MATFSKALVYLKADGTVKREVIKNDTEICIYKNRLYQLSRNTGIRYPYVPTNADLLAEDWIYII